LTEVPAAYHTQINDVLVTALVRALSRWTGERAALLEVEGHGREELSEGADVTRTVGWFTSMYPVRVALGAGGAAVGEELKRVKEQLRAVPCKGIGYGLLRYLSGEGAVAELLRAGEAQAEVSFNYLGQFDQVLGEDGLWQAGAGAVGSVRGEGEERARLLDINGSVVGGRLQMSWTYGSEVHALVTIERLSEWLVEELEGIVRHCREEGAGGYTPSDFPEANLNQSDLDELVALLTEQ
jgi:non-ribosomal peptide synthase protein (TIGR01720 family)